MRDSSVHFSLQRDWLGRKSTIWPFFHQSWPWELGFYLTRDPVLHLERGGGGGKKGVFPSETELRELCLEGGREGGGMEWESDARHGYF